MTPPNDISQLLQARPPARTLAWAEEQAGNGMRMTSVAWMAGGSSHANHAITLADRHGDVRELVLRRWVRPDWQRTDPDFTPQREITALTLLGEAGITAPRLVAADIDGSLCDVSTLLETRLPGHPPRNPADLDEFCRRLAAALPAINGVDGRAQTLVPSYRAYVDIDATAPPPWGATSGNRPGRSSRHHRHTRRASSTATTTPATPSGSTAGSPRSSIGPTPRGVPSASTSATCAGT